MHNYIKRLEALEEKARQEVIDARSNAAWKRADEWEIRLRVLREVLSLAREEQANDVAWLKARKMTCEKAQRRMAGNTDMRSYYEGKAETWQSAMLYIQMGDLLDVDETFSAPFLKGDDTNE